MLILALMMAAADPCDGFTTLDINACLAKQADAAQAKLDHYLTVSRHRLQSDGADPASDTPKLLAGFDAAETAWESYRDRQCDNIYVYWQGGTIRNAMALGCRISLTKERTHMIWKSYLTYMDSTPPVLPEPETD
ncbi:MAG: lysozyme inhibitor LprI family protein [Sphingomonas sp.]